MIASLNPALILIVGALAVPACKGLVRKLYMTVLPATALVLLVLLPYGEHGQVSLATYTLTTLRLDGLSFVFALIFLIATVIVMIYSWHVEDALQPSATLIYAGAAIGAVLAGDLITLFIFWELTAVASVLLIWARRTERAYHAGLRYLVIQVGSGVLLLAGIILYIAQTDSVAFTHLGVTDLATALIFIAFGIKCAFPLVHNWLQDAYPEATITGTVVLSVYTTKVAVYALARGFAGTEMLIWIGATMTVFPIFFAVIENDLRRVLSYSLNNQLGFMVAGIGIGTPLAVNGAVAHAFAHILYKALLFMSMGAVLLRVGTVKASELGGLYKSMPATAVLCMVGSASISAFPLFSGFVTKSMILTAAAEEQLWLTWLVLLFASAGVLDHSGIKVPFFSFFAHDRGIRCAEAPSSMLIAMGLAAVLSIGIGIYPAPLYAILPFAVDYTAYTTSHVLSQLQLLLFAAAAFSVLFRTGLYPPEIPATNLDFDWVYRVPGVYFVRGLLQAMQHVQRVGTQGAARILAYVMATLARQDRALAGNWPTGNQVLWVAALLSAYLVFYYL